MMGELLVIVPSRGRPGNAARLMKAFGETSTARSNLLFAVDEDDPWLPEYKAQVKYHGRLLLYGPRRGMAEWTDQIAKGACADYGAVGSMGDDHLPLTRGWDSRLLKAIEELPGGTGFAYGDDKLQGEAMPTAWVVSSSIVQALGWMCLPGAKHYYVDTAVKTLGEAAGCIRYVPEVVIEHLHPGRTGAVPDATYAEALGGSWEADGRVYEHWRDEGGLERDTAILRKLIEGAS